MLYCRSWRALREQEGSLLSQEEVFSPQAGPELTLSEAVRFVAAATCHREALPGAKPSLSHNLSTGLGVTHYNVSCCRVTAISPAPSMPRNLCCRRKDKHTDRWMDRQRDRWMDGCMDGGRDRKTDRRRQMDGLTD